VVGPRTIGESGVIAFLHTMVAALAFAVAIVAAAAAGAAVSQKRWAAVIVLAMLSSVSIITAYVLGFML
jgi:limonene-1,2-epoxide hydrolase